MSIPVVPAGWIHDREHAEPMDEMFNHDSLYDLPKPYHTLLVDETFHDYYLIQCGTPGSEDLTQFCYVVFSKQYNAVSRIVSPRSIEEIATALSYWDDDIEQPTRGVKLERLLVFTSYDAEDNYRKFNMTIPSAPRGWVDHARSVDINDEEFNRTGLFVLPRPYKTLLTDQAQTYLIQCGEPGSDDSTKLCYVLDYPAASKARRIVFPLNIQEIWTALPYLEIKGHPDNTIKTEAVPVVESVYMGGFRKTSSRIG